MTFKVSVVGRKGGVGKTTTAIHVAAHLAFGDRRTLLIDGDARNYATTWAAGGHMPFTVDGIGGLMAVAEYDAAVIDSQADPSEQDISTLGKHSTVLLLPAVPEAQAVSGLIQTVQVLDRAGVSRDRVCVLLTMDTRVGTATQDAREALTGAGLRVLSRTIRDTVAFRHASGQSVLVHQVRNTAGKMAWEDYRAVTQELLELGQ
ncbi:ParA family protein [Deinococcus sp. HMF7604]|uniref:ParA family protein n=1 Tax=Deinococcus betulae TaxID=2873312 RepID=UPI001CCA4FA4|nr:ParA family protein [Deinococcus betulae]MBZ9753203.1 ParA family protein [Deinococcus betulae]